MAFVSEFDGTSFRYVRGAPGDRYEEECVLDVVAAIRGTYSSRVREYERRVGEDLWPVGFTGSGHVVLMMSASGKVYGGYDDYLALYGEGGRIAIRNIADGESVVRVS